MLHLERIIDLSPVVPENPNIRGLCNLERGEGIHNHESCEVRPAVGPTEDVLVVQEVSPEENRQGLLVSFPSHFARVHGTHVPIEILFSSAPVTAESAAKVQFVAMAQRVPV